MSSLDCLPENWRESIETSGFLLLKISADVRQSIELVIEAAYRFFRCTAAEKILNTLPEDAGFRPYGVEYSYDPTQPDQVESFTMTARHSAASLPSLRAQVLASRMLFLFNQLEELAEILTIQLATAVADHSFPSLNGGFHRWSRLQLNYARPRRVMAPYIHEAHEDGNLLTLACATGPGLELRTGKAEFVQMTVNPGELVVMPGQIAWLLSGGQIRPQYHRVRPHSGSEERIALLFFGDLSPSLCAPWLENEINRGVDIGHCVQTSVNRFGLQGFEHE